MSRDAAVEAAEAFIEKLAARTHHGGRRHLKSLARKAELHREDAKLAGRELAASGVDVRRLDVLVAERAPAHRRLIEEERVRAVAASEAAALRLRALTPVPLVDPTSVIIDEVTFIRSFIGTGVVSDQAIAPGENSAQYRFRSDDPDIADTGRLSFFTLWQNPSRNAKVVTAAARLMVNAGLSADCDGSGIGAWFGIDGGASAAVRARTTIWALWNSALFAVGSDVSLGSVEANGGFFGDSDSNSIEFNDMLPAAALMVPKQDYVLIEVELLTDWSVLGGSFDLDAESGAFRVSLPSITLSLG